MMFVKEKIRDIVQNPDKVSSLAFDEIEELIQMASNIFETEKSLLEIKGNNILFVGDTHGDFDSTKRIVEMFLNGKYDYIIFLGDYVDRGVSQIENLNYVLCLKLLYPESVILLRGNHETPLANLYYGFYHEILRKLDRNFYDRYSKLFAKMPYAVLVNDHILTLHGGIAEYLKTLQQIEKIEKNLVEARDPLVLQILWNDPREGISGFQPSMRGPGIRVFGRDAFEKFAKENGIDLMIRAHEVFPEGYRYFFDEEILSIFSARNYVIPVNAKIAELSSGKDIKLIDV